MERTITIQGQDLTIRDAVAEDVEYIFPRWMESARELRNTKLSVFNMWYPNVVRSLLQSEAAVVAHKRGGSALIGWACGRPPNLLHSVYVEYPLRGHGIGKALVEAILEGYPDVVWVTSSPLSMPHHRRYTYNPFVMRTA